MSETLHKIFQRRIRERRDGLELTQRDAARLTGLGQTYISGLETGANQPPAFEVLVRMARTYRTTTDYLLGLSEDMAGTAGVISPEAERVLNIFERLSPLAQEIALEQLLVLRKVDDRRRQRLQGAVWGPLAGSNAAGDGHGADGHGADGHGADGHAAGDGDGAGDGHAAGDGQSGRDGEGDGRGRIAAANLVNAMLSDDFELLRSLLDRGEDGRG